MDWAMILVIILSIFLAFFLLLSIILIVQLLRVTKQIKSVTSTAERAAQKFESVATNVATFSSPAMIAKIVTNFIKKSKKSK